MRTLFVSYVEAQMLLWLERTKLTEYPCTVLLHHFDTNTGVLMVLIPYFSALVAFDMRAYSCLCFPISPVLVFPES